MSVTISGTGVFTPSQKISNKELVQSYNKYADSHNEKHKIDKKIFAGIFSIPVKSKKPATQKNTRFSKLQKFQSFQ